MVKRKAAKAAKPAKADKAWKAHRAKGVGVLGAAAILLGALMKYGGYALEDALIIAGAIGVVAAIIKYAVYAKK